MYLGILVTTFLAIGSFVNVLFNALKMVISDLRNVGFQYKKTTGALNYIYSFINIYSKLQVK